MSGLPPGARGDRLAGDSQAAEAVEGVAVRGNVAGDEAVFELARDALRLQLRLDRALVLDVAPRAVDEVVDIRVAAEDGEVRGLLREGRRPLGPHGVDGVEGGAAEGVLLVVFEGVALDGDEGQPIEDRRLLDDGLDHAPLEHVCGKLRALGQC